MMISQLILSKLWWGPWRRPFEAILRRVLPKRSKVLFGPVRGSFIAGGLAQIIGIYEVHIQDALIKMLKPGDVYYDVGANIGYMTIVGAKKVRSHGHVYAFEPFPENVEKIHAAVVKNNIQNCTIIQQAASNVCGSADLYLEATSSVTPSLVQHHQGRRLSVSTTTLDEFVKRNRWPNLIKMDVEGAESIVLEGALALISSESAPHWIIEIHSDDNDHEIRKMFDIERYQIKYLTSPKRNGGFYPKHILITRRTL